MSAMGTLELEILKRMAKDRFDLDIEFDRGTVIYKETIASPVTGIGHFEPLRHYAEVHLLLGTVGKRSRAGFLFGCERG